MNDFVILGIRRPPPTVSVPVPSGYERLMRNFGPGDFVDGISLLGPSDVSTLGERVPDCYDDPALASLVVFATTTSGAFFCWNSAGRVLFVPREATRLGDVEDVCDDVAGWPEEVTDSKFTPDGLEQAFFIPAGALPESAEWQAEAPGPHPTVHDSLRAALEARAARVLSFVAGTKLTRTQFTSDELDSFVSAQTLSPELRGRSRFNTRIRALRAGTTSLEDLRRIFVDAGWRIG